MSSSAVTFVSMVNLHQHEQGILEHLFFPLQQVHPLELMHNSLRELPSAPEYKLDFKKKSPLEHYVQGRSDRNHCTVSWKIRSCEVFGTAEEQPEDTDPTNAGIKKINALLKGTERKASERRDVTPTKTTLPEKHVHF